MTEISPEILEQLALAQAELAQSMEAGDLPVAAEVAAPEITQPTIGAAGSGTAKYLLMDHYFSGSLRRLWAHVGSWHYKNVSTVEEQGLAQVAFASKRVDAWWDNNNQLTILRCWKSF